jgi:hypothetical protein
VEDQLALVYGIYLAVTIGLCVGLARLLFRNGAVFLDDVFEDRPELAESVNRLLVTGFAMLNLGYGFFLTEGGEAGTSAEVFELLARKLGILLVSLAVIHFVNLAVFHTIANRRRQARLVPPVAPQRWVDDSGTPWTDAAVPPPPPAPVPAATHTTWGPSGAGA